MGGQGLSNVVESSCRKHQYRVVLTIAGPPVGCSPASPLPHRSCRLASLRMVNCLATAVPPVHGCALDGLIGYSPSATTRPFVYAKGRRQRLGLRRLRNRHGRLLRLAPIAHYGGIGRPGLPFAGCGGMPSRVARTRLDRRERWCGSDGVGFISERAASGTPDPLCLPSLRRRLGPAAISGAARSSAATWTAARSGAGGCPPIRAGRTGLGRERGQKSAARLIRPSATDSGSEKGPLCNAGNFVMPRRRGGPSLRLRA